VVSSIRITLLAAGLIEGNRADLGGDVARLVAAKTRRMTLVVFRHLPARGGR
jgi:hypothetical protein